MTAAGPFASFRASHNNRFAIGGGADMDDRAAMDDGDVNDPSETWRAPRSSCAPCLAGGQEHGRTIPLADYRTGSGVMTVDPDL